MKHAVLSIIVAILGMVWIIYLNFQIAAVIEEHYILLATDSTLSISDIAFPMVYKMGGLVIGLIGIFFGIKGYFKTKPLSIVGIALSLLLIALAFIPIYSYLINTALDINIH